MGFYRPTDTLRPMAVLERPQRPQWPLQSVLHVIRSCVSVAVNFNLSSLIQLKHGISLNFSLMLSLHHIILCQGLSLQIWRHCVHVRQILLVRNSDNFFCKAVWKLLEKEAFID